MSNHKQVQTISIYRYISQNNPNGVGEIIYTYGIAKPKNWDRLTNSQRVDFFVKVLRKLSETHGDDFNNELLKLHSDYDIFKDHFKSYYKKKYYNATGDENKKQTTTNDNTHSSHTVVERVEKMAGGRAESMLLGGVVSLGVILMLKHILK
jgi:hypothetical protein